MALEFFERSGIEQAIKRIDELLGCGIFQPQNSRSVLIRAAFIELLIALRDLIFKAEKHASRISFKDNVRRTENVQDVTDLIK